MERRGEINNGPHFNRVEELFDLQNLNHQYYIHTQLQHTQTDWLLAILDIQPHIGLLYLLWFSTAYSA